MDDVIFVAVFVGMMLLAFGYVRLCERIGYRLEHTLTQGGTE